MLGMYVIRIDVHMLMIDITVLLMLYFGEKRGDPFTP